jgi:hypothetical protein
MAIDKESSGLPEVDLKRATTKVNLGIILAAAVFYIITYWLLAAYAKNSNDETNLPSPPIQSSATGEGASNTASGGPKQAAHEQGK